MVKLQVTEDAPDNVSNLLEEQSAKRHCKFFNSYEELLEHLGEDDVVLVKLALISNGILHWRLCPAKRIRQTLG